MPRDDGYYTFASLYKEEQLAIKRSRLLRELKKNEPILNKTKAGKPIGEYPCTEGTIAAKGTLQKNIDDEFNPHITGLEGCSILESSLKNYLTELTVAVVYPPNKMRFHILADISPEIVSIFGNFIERYRDESLELRW